MRTRIAYLATLFVSFLCLGKAPAQSYSNDFENLNEWQTPWLNIHIIEDSTARSGNHLCICDTINEYGFGALIETEGQNQSLNCKFDFWCKWKENNGDCNIVVSIDNENGNLYWQGYPLSSLANDSSDWFQVTLDLNFPLDYLKNSTTAKLYIWNPNKSAILIDNANLDIRTIHTSYLPDFVSETDDNPNFFTLTADEQALSYPIVNLFEYIIDEDTITESVTKWDFIKTNDDNSAQYLSESSLGKTYLTVSNNSSEKTCQVETHFNKKCKLLRQAIVVPFIDSILTIYKKNQKVDSIGFQNEYYLDREGFTIGEGERNITTYHNTKISSLQFDAAKRTAYFNIDYWRDHPLIHYPLNNDTSDYFQNISCKEIDGNTIIKGEFTLFVGTEIKVMPRIMPVWDGYESAFIFTEHADWTDTRTHRAVLFGNEHITRPEDAVGGFVYFGIPVTKSVFFNNPDGITNSQTSDGRFPGLHATIKTDNEFYQLLKSLKGIGFDICLHTPEQYTTVGNNLSKALKFMANEFGSPTWIDHGYNNGSQNNRENLVCDALLPDAQQYAEKLWKKNNVRYLWNAYYEENRMEHLNFDGHFVQPYDGFGDAMPNRQITTLPNDDYFRLWATPSTLEVNTDDQWYYYFEAKRLQRLVDNRNVFITHTYPAWTDPDRAFWQYNEDSTAVAMPGFNFALQQIANLRDEKKMLPTTIQDYLSFYEGLLNVDYKILNDNTIQLTNNGQDIKGLTLLSENPIQIEGKNIETRQTEEGHFTWFDLNKNEKVIIQIQ